MTVKVQVYDGHALKSVETPPDYAAVADEAASIFATCSATDEQIERSGRAALELAKKYETARLASIAVLNELSAKPAYKDAATRYQATWVKTASDLAATSDIEAREKYVLAGRSAFFDDTVDLSRFIADGIDVEPFLATRLTALKKDDKLFQSLSKSMFGADSTTRAADAKFSATMAVRDFSTLKQSIEALQEWSVFPESEFDAMKKETVEVVADTEKAVSTLRDLRGKELKGALAAVGAASGVIIAKSRALGAGGNGLNTEEQAKLERELDKGIEDLMKATQEFSSAADNALEKSEIVRFVSQWREYLRDLPNRRGDVAVLIVKAPAEVQAELQKLPAAENIDLQVLQRRFASFERAAAKTGRMSRGISSRSEFLIRLAHAQPFHAADPNLSTISSDESREHWRQVPLDELQASGDGLAQYIIVQDGPTSYRLKELHVDPTNVVRLQITIADAGVELLTKAAAIASGVDLSSVLSKGGQSEPAPSQSLGPDAAAARERQLEDLTRDTLREILTNLRAIQKDAADLSKIEGVRAKLRGTLNGYAKRLEGVRDEVGDAKAGGDGVKK